MQNCTPRRSTASAMVLQSATVVASTFSVKMCLPALAARTITSRCRLVGATTHTASTSSRASSAFRSASNGTFMSFAHAWPRTGSSSQAAAKSAWGLARIWPAY